VTSYALPCDSVSDPPAVSDQRLKRDYNATLEGRTSALSLDRREWVYGRG